MQDLLPGTFSGLANLDYLLLTSNFIKVISALQPTSRSMRPFSVSREIRPHAWVLQHPRMTKGRPPGRSARQIPGPRQGGRFRMIS